MQARRSSRNVNAAHVSYRDPNGPAGPSAEERYRNRVPALRREYTLARAQAVLPPNTNIFVATDSAKKYMCSGSAEPSTFITEMAALFLFLQSPPDEPQDEEDEEEEARRPLNARDNDEIEPRAPLSRSPRPRATPLKANTPAAISRVLHFPSAPFDGDSLYLFEKTPSNRSIPHIRHFPAPTHNPLSLQPQPHFSMHRKTLDPPTTRPSTATTPWLHPLPEGLPTKNTLPGCDSDAM
ncbi:hypothetical protein NMY22_g6943 [Coprinellus aureogranulatus]|nr:hypothetical protein NMY22_g6943 [Coprinellus aureogranulatus]